MSDDRYVLRIRPEDKARWRSAADREGRTLAGLIKWAVEEYLKRKASKATPK